MYWIAQASDGETIYYMVRETLEGVHLGVGWEVFLSEAEMHARWSGLPEINVDDPQLP